MKAFVGTFNKEKAQVGAFTRHCETSECSLAALVLAVIVDCALLWTLAASPL